MYTRMESLGMRPHSCRAASILAPPPSLSLSLRSPDIGETAQSFLVALQILSFLLDLDLEAGLVTSQITQHLLHSLDL